MGGFNCNSTFDYLDFDIIRKNPKIFCGYSDPTSLINVIYAKTGLVTFHGPNFKSLSDEETDYGFCEMKKRFFDGELELGSHDEYNTIKKGRAEGKLIRWEFVSFFEFDFWEISCRCYTERFYLLRIWDLKVLLGMISNYLYRLKQNGVFEKINGLWIGNYEHSSGISLEKIVLDTLEDEYNFPIVKSDNFGHGLLKTVIPVGTNARIDTDDKVKIKLLEDCLI